MEVDHDIWREWARALHRWGFGKAVAALFENAGSLLFLGAQVIYLGQPFINPLISEDKLNNLAKLLENSRNRSNFLNALREDLD